MPEITTISVASVKRLVKRVSDLEKQVAAIAPPGRGGAAVGGGPTMYFATADSAISAKVDGTWGTGAVNLTVYDTGVSDFRETTLAQTVRNRHNAEFANDELVRISQDASGDYQVDPLPYKGLIRFTLSADMSDEDSSAGATIANQYGIGTDETDTSITVYNLLASDSSTYAFDMLSGDAGYALRDTAGKYQVIAGAKTEETGKTRVDDTDTLDYLEDQESYLADGGTYDGAEDLEIAAETTTVVNDDPKLLKFIDASTIKDHKTAGKHALIIVDGLWQFMPIEPCILPPL